MKSVPPRRLCPALLSVLSFKIEKSKGFIGLMVGGDEKAVVVHVPTSATDLQLEAVRDELVASLEKGLPCAPGLARPLVVRFDFALPKPPLELERLALLLNVVDVQTSLPRQ